MSAKERVISQALRLTEEERLEIAETLFASLEGLPDPGADRAWDAEIARRLKDLDAGRARVVPWEEARQQIAGDLDDDARASG